MLDGKKAGVTMDVEYQVLDVAGNSPLSSGVLITIGELGGTNGQRQRRNGMETAMVIRSDRV